MQLAISWMLVIISRSVVSPFVIVLLMLLLGIANITERNHLSRRFRILSSYDVIVSWLCSAFAAHIIRRRFVNGECRIISRDHIFCVSTSLSSQEYTAICRCSHSKPSSSANNLSDSCTSLLFFNRAFF